MSGICGFVLREGKGAVSSSALSSMVHALSFGQDSEVDQTSFDRCGIGGASSTGRRLYVAKRRAHERPVAIWIHGMPLEGTVNPVADRFAKNPADELLDAYLKEGEKFLERLRGDFSLAVWDGLQEKLILATDRFRVHPLFYCQDSKQIVFGSRIQSILANACVKQDRINPHALIDLMAFSAVTSPRTVFTDIQKLPPGHVLTWSNGNMQLSQYWDIDFRSPSSDGEDDLAMQLKSHFGEALSLRAAADADSQIGVSQA